MTKTKKKKPPPGQTWDPHALLRARPPVDPEREALNKRLREAIPRGAAQPGGIICDERPPQE